MLKRRTTSRSIAAMAGLAGALLVIVAARSAPAQSASGFLMEPAALYSVGGAAPKITGGVLADPAEWPATFIFAHPDAKDGHCTSTVIGARVVLTAAHCIAATTEKGKIVLSGGETLTLECTRHVDYDPDVSSNNPAWEKAWSPDFALCAVVAGKDDDDPAEDIEGFDYDVIDTVGSRYDEGDKLHLLGFGCNEEGGVDEGFGVLYEGDSPVKRLPDPAADSYYTVTETGAAVCYGDSGGGAYLFLTPGSRARRVVVGVNSSVDTDKYGHTLSTSYLSTVSEKGFVDWARTWANDHKKYNVEICGLHPTAKGCRAL